MLFTAVFVVGHSIWLWKEFRRLGGIKCFKSPKLGEGTLSLCKGFYIPDFFTLNLLGCEDFEVRSSDIWISTFPKSGTTWTQEMTYLLVHDFDFEKAKSAPLDIRMPFLEFPYPGKEAIDMYPSPRVIKTHLPFSLLPRAVREGKCKLIYVMRNPKDVVVSMHHFMNSLSLFRYNGSIQDTADLLVDGTVMYGPYWKHIQEYWELRDRRNVFITTYEEMQRDLPGVIRAVAAFLDKKATEEQVMQTAKWCSFAEMKKNPMANYEWYNNNDEITMTGEFMRKGIVGDWKGHLNEESVMKIDAMENRELTPLGITF